MDSNNNAICTCRSGYSGDKCEVSSFCQNQCQNGAICIDNTLSGGTYTCLCLANYYGVNCEYQVTSQACSQPNGDTNSLWCSQWYNQGFCSFKYSYIKVPVPVYCPNSCGLCKTVSSCQDSQATCSVWANFGLCTLVNSKDPNLCKRSCGSCAGLIKKRKILEQTIFASPSNSSKNLKL